MLIKASIIGCALLASTPVCIVATMQDKEGQDGAAASAAAQDGVRSQIRSEVEALRQKIQELQAELGTVRDGARTSAEKAADRTEESVHRIEELNTQLKECLDLLEKSATVTTRRRSCTPSRARSLLTYYQWMQERGHEQRAARILKHVVKETGDRTSKLNELAWRLMTEKSSTGKFDRAALALVERMQKKGRLRHNQLDTVALAMFLNGRVDDAVKLQQQAVKVNNNDQYRRRLRVYQAAKLNQPRTLPGVGGE